MAIYPYKTKKGKKWRVQRTVTTKIGIRKTICKRGFESEKEARNYDIDLAYALKQDIFYLQNIVLDSVFEDYLIDKQKEVSVLWFEKIKQMYSNYIKDAFGNKSIQKITTMDIIRWKRTLDDLELSVAYKRKIFTTFNAIIKHAMLCFDLRDNPLQKVGNFKDSKSSKRDVVIWQENEVVLFLNSFDNSKDYVYFAFFATEIYTGMRNCEAFALQWKDIDFIENTIYINKSLTQKVRGTRKHIGNTKTTSSYRIIDMPKELHNILKMQFKHMKELEEFSEEWFVFGKHSPIAESTMNAKRIKYCKKAGVPIISCHKIRHTHISHLIANGANPLAVSKRVGHASTKMTLDTYGHSIDKTDSELLDIISGTYSIRG